MAAVKTQKNRFNKPVAFNRSNEEDQMILEHLEDKNFSGYVKELILRDMNGESGSQTETSPLDTEYTGTLRIVQRSQNGGIRYVMTGNIGSPGLSDTSPLPKSTVTV